jgi:hypothetical protein
VLFAGATLDQIISEIKTSRLENDGSAVGTARERPDGSDPLGRQANG